MVVRPYGELNLDDPGQREILLSRLREIGLPCDPAALSYSLPLLSEDWRRIPEALVVCSLKVGSKRSEGIDLPVWLSVMQSVYDFWGHARFDRVVQRLRLPSHEKLDTVLVLQVARRFHMRGCTVTFEPFDQATTDLLMQRDRCRLYIEIKRENPGEHHRVVRVNEVGGIIIGALEQTLRPMLVDRQIRLEVSIPNLFSNDYAKRFATEIRLAAQTMQIG